MVIQWFGHSSFLIVSEQGTRIITDPYESGAFSGTINYAPISVPADIVTVSHDHADHSCVECVPGEVEVVSRPGKTTVKGIEINGIQSFHDSAEGTLRGTNVAFVMHVDGIRILHLGDIGHELSFGELEQIGEVDMVLIPVGGYYTIDAEQATHVINRLYPRVVIPMHYKTDKVDLPIASVDPFLRGKENVVRMFTSEYEVTKDTLPDDMEIIVLQHAL